MTAFAFISVSCRLGRKIRNALDSDHVLLYQTLCALHGLPAHGRTLIERVVSVALLLYDVFDSALKLGNAVCISSENKGRKYAHAGIGTSAENDHFAGAYRFGKITIDIDTGKIIPINRLNRGNLEITVSAGYRNRLIKGNRAVDAVYSKAISDAWEE